MRVVSREIYGQLRIFVVHSQEYQLFCSRQLKRAYLMIMFKMLSQTLLSTAHLHFCYEDRASKLRDDNDGLTEKIQIMNHKSSSEDFALLVKYYE